MTIKNITSYLESIAPPSYQESYDNSGLIVGNPATEVTGILLCLDSTEAVLDEAIDRNCNLIIAHHPIVFRGLKRFNGSNYVERVVMKAIQYEVAIYAIHTNLDNVYHNGVNGKIAEKLGLTNTRILAPKPMLKKLQTFVPATHSQQVRHALYEAGAGTVGNFSELSHSSIGMATQNGHGNHAEVRIELLFAAGDQRQVLHALRQAHPDTTAPYDIIPVENRHPEVGSGMIGELAAPVKESKFLKRIQKQMKARCVRYTKLRNRKVRKVAVCGGSGSFLLSKAIAQGADVFVTADFKYHEFFDAEQKIVIADIGHYESEQFTIDLLHDLITEKFRTFAVYLTRINTNPVNYLV